jgi:glycosyltransferase involved in cell wall biosynthesis
MRSKRATSYQVPGRECAAVVPCLNEGDTIGPLTEAVRQYLGAVFIVDDGSSDQTARRALAAGAEVLAHDTTRGKGAALQTGWRRALDRGFKYALTLDGDGQHSPEDIPAFFQCVERTGAAMVVGNRMAGTQRMPLVRRLVNRWMSRQLSRIADQSLPDSQCGFRLVNLETWAALPIRTQRFEIESEVLLAFIRAGHRVEFVPIRVIYKDEQSKIHPLQDAIRWFRWKRSLRCGLTCGKPPSRKLQLNNKETK